MMRPCCGIPACGRFGPIGSGRSSMWSSSTFDMYSQVIAASREEAAERSLKSAFEGLPPSFSQPWFSGSHGGVRCSGGISGRRHRRVDLREVNAT